MNKISLWLSLFPLLFSLQAYADVLTPNLTIKGHTAEQKFISIELNPNEIKTQFPTYKITTELPWINNYATFSGARLKDILSHYQLFGSQVHLTALNDYSVTIPYLDIYRYNPIIAITQNQNPLKIRNYGPYWLIYPMSKYPELNTPKYHARMIWQIKTIQVEK
ncbi:oxidoreductase [Photobacterium damselae]|uniref:oxidoreductase n=1 Tax=Photobacterium damselae TaxID=38293 RepID=UPI000D66376B|nr:oxidoreductase [Photobacterium damselae]AWK82225.1 hypothetical protein BST98_09325 [Photobacterium damselae]